ncbi:MAG: hypothetical protein ACK5NG_01705 [Chthoniobacterales bacterium]
MEKRYSRGTKGRLERHADLCKKHIYDTCPTPDLAIEFIETVDPDQDNAVWQQFKEPADVLPEVRDWLSPPEASAQANASAEKLSSVTKLPLAPNQVMEGRIDIALKRTRAWLTEDVTRKKINTLSPAEAARFALERMHHELQKDTSGKDNQEE